MVVTRRTPVVPAPPVSGTSSSQATPRTSKGKAREVNGDVDETRDAPKTSSGPPTATTANSGPSSSSPNSKSSSKAKSKKNKKRRGQSSWLELFSKAFILCFTIYTIAICPSDESLQSPICRGLSAYRRFVLEPYILPVINAALSHPTVSPYVDSVKPRFDSAVNAANPVLVQAQGQWNDHVVPQWRKRVVPQWKKRIVPQWNKHIAPRIHQVEKALQPYLDQLSSEYQIRVAPCVRAVVLRLELWKRASKPYVQLAADKANSAYQATKPYAAPAWEHFKDFVGRFLVTLRQYRRELVDPHLATLWEKVKELSSGKPPASATASSLNSEAPVPEALTTSSVASSAIPSTDVSNATVATTATPSTTMQETSSIVPTSLPSSVVENILFPEATEVSVLATLSEVAPGVKDDTSPTSFDIPEEGVTASASSAASVISESIVVAASAASAYAESISEKISSSAASLLPSSLPITGPSVISVTSPMKTSEPVDDEDAEVDLAEFYEELGLHESDTDKTEEPLPPPPIQVMETEEEKAERLRLKAEETAQERARITKLHTRLEGELQELIKAKKKELRRKLVSIRKPAAEKLKSEPIIRAQIEGLVKEAEKFLKGAEVYMKTLQKETEGDKVKGKEALWTRVVEKVEKRFEQRLEEASKVVNEWIDTSKEPEWAVLAELTAEVANFASQAQGDLGLGYAWLDDVTYHDWERYHALVDKAEEFDKQAKSIQDGSHPSPPIDPVKQAVDELESEVHDVVLGFETRLRRIRRQGQRAFGITPVAEEDEDDEPELPEVSILPAKPVDPKKEDPLEDVPPVLIGKDAEQVLSALRDDVPIETTTAVAASPEQSANVVAHEEL